MMCGQPTPAVLHQGSKEFRVCYRGFNNENGVLRYTIL